MPLVVLTAGEEAPLPDPIPDEARHATAQLIRDLHGELARESSIGRVEVVEGSGHMIHHQRPDAVVAAVRDVVEAVRVR